LFGVSGGRLGFMVSLVGRVFAFLPVRVCPPRFVGLD